MQELIDAFVEALKAINAPVEQTRSAGLSPDELETLVADRYEGYFVQYIDDDIRAWFSWQHGCEYRLIKAHRPPGDLWGDARTISPGGFSLAKLDVLIDEDWLEEQYIDASVAFPTEPMFPILTDGRSGLVYLRRMQAGAEWTIWLNTPETGMSPAGHPGRPAPTFRGWIATLTEALRDKRVVVGPNGRLMVPAELTDSFDPNSYGDRFPWA